MPRVTPIREILELKNHGDVVTCVKGKLVQIYDVKSGEGQYGPWTMQTGTIKDSTGEIRVTFKNIDPINKNQRNQMVTIEAVETEEGWRGLNYNVRTYTDKNGQEKTSKELSATPASIRIFGESPSSGAAPSRPAQTSQPQPQRSQAPTAKGPANPASAKTQAMQFGNLHAIAVLAAFATHARVEELHPGLLSNDSIRAIGTTIAIELFRRDMQMQMPATPIEFGKPKAETPPPPPPPPPTPEPDPVQDPDPEINTSFDPEIGF